MRRMLIPAYLVLTTTGLTAAVAQNAGNILHVSNRGSDTAGCGVAAQPCRSISQAIANAAPGDTIRVGPGRYGDLNGNGVFGEPGEERPRREEITAPQGNPEEIDCIVCIDKALKLVSTQGAHATSIQGMPGRSTGDRRVSTVQIYATGVIVGGKSAGFTISGSDYALSTLAGNLSIVDNIATSTGSGFHLVPGGNPPVYTPYSNGWNGAVTVIDNLSLGNLGGFFARGFEPENYVRMVNNVAIGHSGVGFTLEGFAPHVMDRNTSTGNSVGASGDGGPFQITHNILNANTSIGLQLFRASTAWAFTAQATGNSIVGNVSTGIEVSNTSAELHENNIFANGSNGSNCGLFTYRSGPNATNNYWGAATGPGPDPADSYQGVIEDTTPNCNGGNSDIPLTVTPFATQPFDIRP